MIHKLPQRECSRDDRLGQSFAEDCGGSEQHWALAVLYASLSLLMFPIGIALVAGWVLGSVRGLRAATSRAEKIYWRLNIVSHLLFAYALLVLVALAIDGLLGEPWRLSDAWPAMWRYWSTSNNKVVIVLFDVLSVLCLALLAICLSRCFGYRDEYDVWKPSAWIRRRNGSFHVERRRPDTPRRSKAVKRNERLR